jgi:hypothetical protein
MGKKPLSAYIFTTKVTCKKQAFCGLIRRRRSIHDRIMRRTEGVQGDVQIVRLYILIDMNKGVGMMNAGNLTRGLED